MTSLPQRSATVQLATNLLGMACWKKRPTTMAALILVHNIQRRCDDSPFICLQPESLTEKQQTAHLLRSSTNVARKALEHCHSQKRQVRVVWPVCAKGAHSCIGLSLRTLTDPNRSCHAGDRSLINLREHFDSERVKRQWTNDLSSATMNTLF